MFAYNKVGIVGNIIEFPLDLKAIALVSTVGSDCRPNGFQPS